MKANSLLFWCTRAIIFIFSHFALFVDCPPILSLVSILVAVLLFPFSHGQAQPFLGKICGLKAPPAPAGGPIALPTTPARAGGGSEEKKLNIDWTKGLSLPTRLF